MCFRGTIERRRPTIRNSRASIGLSMLLRSIAESPVKTCANDRVQFVDEGNDLPIGLFDLFKDWT